MTDQFLKKIQKQHVTNIKIRAINISDQIKHYINLIMKKNIIKTSSTRACILFEVILLTYFQLYAITTYLLFKIKDWEFCLDSKLIC